MSMLQSIENAMVTAIGKVHWTEKNLIVAEEQQIIRNKLSSDYYIILTRNNSHLSTYAICISNFFLTGKWGYWGHALMNFEDAVTSDADFKLVESVGVGVRYGTFDEVFATNSAVLLKPKNMDIGDWTLILDKAKSDIGKPYDTLFDLQQDKALSCVELVRDALKADPTYSTSFAHFEAMAQKYDRITPDMFYGCPDFEVAFEIRRR